MGKWINIDDLPSDRVEWDDILDAPSIDIVRCKECKHKDEIVNYCYKNDRNVNPDDFCSYGEVRDE